MPDNPPPPPPSRPATPNASTASANEAVRLAGLLAQEVSQWQEPMEVDQTQVYPLPEGVIAQVDFGQSWKQQTGYFDGFPKSITEVSNLVRSFEQAITSGNWTHHMACNNFQQILTGAAKTWLELVESYDPRIIKHWPKLKSAFLTEFQTVKNEAENHKQIARLVQGKSEPVRNFSYRVKHTVAVIHNYKAELPRGATEIQKTIAMMLKRHVEYEINLHFMNGIHKELKDKMEANMEFHKATIDEKIALAIRIERILDPKDLPISEMAAKRAEAAKKAAEGIPEEEEEPKKEKSEDEIKKEISALNRELNQRHGGSQQPRGGYRGRGRGRGNGYQTNQWRGNGNQGYRNNYGNNRGYNNNYSNRGYNNQGGGGRWNGGGSRGGYQNNQRQRIKCFRCRKFGYHTAQNCPVPSTDLGALSVDDYDTGAPHPYETNEGCSHNLNYQGGRQ